MLQALIVDSMHAGILNVPPPILTRSFQEISQGMLKAHEALKIVNVPYPHALHAASSMFIFLHNGLTIWYSPRL